MKILASNALASIQDLGRFGFRSLGVGTNGAMDPWALQAANALLQNPLDTAAIEIALGSFSVQFEQDTCFCLTGGLYEAYLDEKRVYGYWRITAKARQTLKLVRPLQGMYAYLAVQGGFDIEPVLGSSSTNTKAEFGGYKGRFLSQGDQLTLASPNKTPALSNSEIGVAALSAAPSKLDSQVPQIRVVANSEYDQFTEAAKQNFENQLWRIDTSSNRMGYRCVGESSLEFAQTLEMSSHGVAAGMIQVPPQGQPIVLMADSQTTGGYPKIATVIEADLGLMAQIRFGQSCQFKRVSIEEAIRARQDIDRYIERIRRYAHDH